MHISSSPARGLLGPGAAEDFQRGASRLISRRGHHFLDDGRRLMPSLRQSFYHQLASLQEIGFAAERQLCRNTLTYFIRRRRRHARGLSPPFPDAASRKEPRRPGDAAKAGLESLATPLIDRRHCRRFLFLDASNDIREKRAHFDVRPPHVGHFFIQVFTRLAFRREKKCTMITSRDYPLPTRHQRSRATPACHWLETMLLYKPPCRRAFSPKNARRAILY